MFAKEIVDLMMVDALTSLGISVVVLLVALAILKIIIGDIDDR